MEVLLERAGSRFGLVSLSGLRAREINDYYNQLGEGLGKIVPPQITSRASKPLSIAIEEIELGKIEASPLPTDEELAAEAQARAESAAPGVDDGPPEARKEIREPLWQIRPGQRPRRKDS
jgi:DNA-directed RNA polymerase subunit omega